jgi:hypothetical protein
MSSRHAVAAALLLVAGVACGQTEHPLRGDRAPIARHFPALGQFQSVQWQAGTTDDDRWIPSVPPTVYWIEALVHPAGADLDALGRDYAWTPVPAGWHPKLRGGALAGRITAGRWARSPAACQHLLEGSDYAGDCYLDRGRGLLFLRVSGGT